MPRQEFVDFQVMREMHCSWEQLQATPIDVRAAWWEFIQMERQVAAARAEKAERERQGEQGAMRIAR